MNNTELPAQSEDKETKPELTPGQRLKKVRQLRKVIKQQRQNALDMEKCLAKMELWADQEEKRITRSFGFFPK